MRIDVVGKHMEVTDPIREYAEQKAAKLVKFFDGVQEITIHLTADTHHQTGSYDVEFVIAVVKHDDFVAKAQDEDIYKAIDAAVAKSTRQLTDFKEKLRESKRS
ncbi:MAG: ribosome hibernation-promoting factor, HPF/YfiA family [Phycisphaerales bacterium JB037]|jgi:putative sigma-54 modulation protein